RSRHCCFVLLHASHVLILMLLPPLFSLLFFFTSPPPSLLYTFSLHDALPISSWRVFGISVEGLGNRALLIVWCRVFEGGLENLRSEEHTTELQSRFDLVCRLLLEK